MESYQPHSSVKDRIALRMIEDAEKKGFIKPGITTIIEPTSGNLGIGLAYIARRKGYKFIAVVRSHNSSDKRMLLRYLGADVLVTDSKDGFKGIMDRVEELKTKYPNAHVLDQFNNPSNPVEHFMSTDHKITDSFASKSLNHPFMILFLSSSFWFCSPFNITWPKVAHRRMMQGKVLLYPKRKFGSWNCRCNMIK